MSRSAARALSMPFTWAWRTYISHAGLGLGVQHGTAIGGSILLHKPILPPLPGHHCSGHGSACTGALPDLALLRPASPGSRPGGAILPLHWAAAAMGFRQIWRPVQTQELYTALSSKGDNACCSPCSCMSKISASTGHVVWVHHEMEAC